MSFRQLFNQFSQLPGLSHGYLVSHFNSDYTQTSGINCCLSFFFMYNTFLHVDVLHRAVVLQSRLHWSTCKWTRSAHTHRWIFTWSWLGLGHLNMSDGPIPDFNFNVFKQCTCTHSGSVNPGTDLPGNFTLHWMGGAGSEICQGHHIS